MSRESFAKKLQDIIKNAGIPQNVIAEALNLSSAAISQFVHGITLPNPEQLSSILVLLCIPDEEQVPLMQQLYLLREESGEESEDEYFSDDDDDEQFVNGANFETIFTHVKPTDDEIPPFLIFAEPQVGGIPVIHLHDLDNYHTGMGLHDFATMLPHDLLLRDFGSSGTPVAIHTTGSQLGLRYCGMVQLIIAEDVPFGLSSVALLCLPGCKYRLIPAGNRNSYRGLESLFDMKLKIDAEPLWVFPVMEFTLLPMGNIYDPEKDD